MSWFLALWGSDPLRKSCQVGREFIGVVAFILLGAAAMARPPAATMATAGTSTPGTTAYPDAGFTPCSGGILSPSGTELGLMKGAIDSARGHAYYATESNPSHPGQLIEVAIGDGDTTPTVLSTVTMPENSGTVSCSAVDEAGGVALFGTMAGVVIQMSLDTGGVPPAVVGTLPLPMEERFLGAAVFDPVERCAYFATSTKPIRVIKVAEGQRGLPPRRLSSTTLPPEDWGSDPDILASAAIDSAHRHAYFVTSNSLVKIGLTGGEMPPLRIGSAQLPLNDPGGIVIDPAHGYAYVALHYRVAKMSLGEGDNPPSCIGVTQEIAYSAPNSNSAIIDVAAGHAWFGYRSKLVKLALGDGDALPTVVGAYTLPPGEDGPYLALKAPASSHAVVVTRTNALPHFSCRKLALGSGNDLPTRVAECSLGDQSLWQGIGALALDPAAGYGYLASDGNSGLVGKIALGQGSAPPARLATLGGVLDQPRAAVIDPGRGCAWFGSSYTQVLTLGLGGGSSPPTALAYTDLESRESGIVTALLDPDRGHIYFATASGSYLVKYSIGEPTSPLTRLGATLLASDERQATCAVIDTAHGYAYVGTDAYSPLGKVVKLALGEGDALPVRIGALTIPAEYGFPITGVIDTESGYAYFGTTSQPGKVLKVALGEGDALPSIASVLTFPIGENGATNAVINTTAGWALFGATNPSDSTEDLVKVGLGSGAEAPTRIGALQGRRYYPLGLDETNGYAFVGTWSYTGLSKIAFGHQGFLRGNRITMPVPATVEDIRFHSHTASGHVRLALYDDASPRNLLWQSGPVANDAAESDLIVPVSSGTPPTLAAAAGTYWIAWQVDSVEDIPSYTAGTDGDGFRLALPFGPAPPQFDASQVTPTSEVWTEFLTYSTMSAVEASLLGLQDPSPGTTCNGDSVVDVADLLCAN